MKYIEDYEINNKKVILRLDLNVPIKNNEILDQTKIIASIPTIEYLLKRNCHIMILSHLGKIEKEEDKDKNSLKRVSEVLSELLNKEVKFIENPCDERLKNILDDEILVMIENTRYMDYPNKLESKCDMKLAQFWAQAGDVFVNDAFATSHRKHASNFGISKLLPSVYGLLFKKELDGLNPIINDVKKPFSVIMGGKKVDDKINLIKKMLEKCDNLIVGGGIANTFLKAFGYNIGKSIYSESELENVKKIIKENKNKIIIPNDVYVLSNDEVILKKVEEVNDNDIIYDIGLSSLNKISEILEKSNTVFLNGTVGLYEDERFQVGTFQLFSIIEKIDAIKIAGGGDAISSINKFGYASAFDYLSTGGGATLEYISKEKIECFEE